MTINLYNYHCDGDGCEETAIGVEKSPEGWITIPMLQPTNDVEHAHFCSTCRWDTDKQRALGAQLMGTGHWEPEENGGDAENG